MRILLCALLGVCAPALQAKTYAIRIPHQHWQIVVDTPPLTPVDENSGPQGYSYMANSGNFNLSVFVEPPAIPHGSNQQCYEFYWAKSMRNPLIMPDSVKVTHTDAYYRVDYLIDAGGDSRHRNVNYFFAYNDRWVDVHISVMSPTAADEAVFANFDRTLKAQAEDAGGSTHASAAVQILQLRGSDALSISVPPKWAMGAVESPTRQFPFITFPFHPTDGRSAGCLLTVFARYKTGGIKPELLHDLLVGDSKPWIDTTADKRMTEIHQLNFAHGHGVYASFIDASLVGKPPKPHDYKIAVSFILCVQGATGEYLLKISVLCDDLASSEYREAEAMIKTLAEAQ